MLKLRVPPLSSELIKKLDEDYPHLCPHPNDTEREIWMYAGCRALIDTLIQHQQMDDQDQEIH